jgi:multidrug efflux pump subunit AcrA (membrane-fusion protein)
MNRLFKIRKQYLYMGGFVLLLLGWAVISLTTGEDYRNVLTAPVKRGDLVVKVTEAGELVAQHQVTVSAVNDKQILYLAPEGSWVNKGDTLVILESEKYRLYTEEANSALKVARAEYQKALSELEAQRIKEEAAKKEYETLPQLAEKGYVVESEVEQARLNHLEMKARTKSLASVVDARAADVERAMSNLENQQLRLTQSAQLAPGDGIVVYAMMGSGAEARKVEVGVIPFEGMDLIYLPDIGSMLVKSVLNEVDLGKVKIDQPVEIELDAFPGVVFNGRVQSIGTLARRQVNPATGKSTGTKVFDLTIKVEEVDKRLKPGLSATVNIIVSRLDDVLMIPIECVFSTDNNHTFVHLKNGNSFEKRLIEIGQNNDLYVEVKNGLQEEDIVLLNEPG